MAEDPKVRELHKPIHEQTRPLFIHVLTRREQCECGVIVEAERLVVKDAETGQVVRCRTCAKGKVTG